MTQLVVTLNETRKGLLVMWDYRFNTMVDFFIIGLVFSGMMLFIGQGELQSEQLTSALLGFLITFYVMETLNRMSWALMGEAQAGTLEQMYMSPVSTAYILFGRALASFVVATLSLLVIAPTLMVLLNIEVPLPAGSLPIFVITLVGVTGFGLMIAGMTIVFKQVGRVANLLSYSVLFVNGTFWPVENMPDWLASAAKVLPSTQGIVALREVALDGQSLSGLWANGSLTFLTVHSIAFMVLGWFIFRWCENIARIHGSLGHY